MTFHSILALLLIGYASSATAADALVGDWSLSPEQCEKTRITYTADGMNEAWIRDGGGWNKLSSGSYRHNGEQLVVEAMGQSDELRIVRLDDSTLELRNADADRMKELGQGSVSFIRCPAR